MKKNLYILLIASLLIILIPTITYSNTTTDPNVNTPIINTNELKKEGLVPESLFTDCPTISDQILVQTKKTDISTITFEDLQKVKTLVLKDISIKDLPKIIFELSALEVFTIKNTKIDNLDFSKLKYLTNLKSLTLDSINLTAFPVEILELENLEYLNLNMNQIEIIPEEIKNLINLKELHLNKNCFTYIPDNLYELIKLEVLDLSGNSLKTISPKISNLLNLKNLSLEYCLLGSLPDVFMDMNKNLNINVNHNSLLKIPKLNDTQNITYINNFISYIDNEKEMGIILPENNTKLTSIIGYPIEKETINDLLNLTSDVSNINYATKTFYNPHNYQIIFGDGKILPLTQSNTLPLGKYKVKFQLINNSDCNDFAVTSTFIELDVINSISKTIQTSSIAKEKVKDTKPEPLNISINKNSNFHKTLPITGESLFTSSLLKGLMLIIVGIVFYRKSH